eukprot:CAMPEP_0174834630 /NCGR_PEP_ID=MMETSP1114-20130205/4943_1 /TAXON_ID=312471 /ORGANISM="Neobodo designis, Strain CCAP 1951/1" /LENGTH=411 /DNA_ID=CAMNT_0016068551 /DNA_START=41 /DNA_END=1276 /DNA_ORIENTATION=-
MRRPVWLLVVALLDVALGFRSFQGQIPNGASVTSNGQAWPGVGHLAPGGGGALNAFGVAWRDAGRRWSTVLCAADSDGDGFTNGAELGDPDCIWVPGASPGRATGISHPGFASSVPPTNHSQAPNTTAASFWTSAAPTSVPHALTFTAMTTAASADDLAATLRVHLIGALNADVDVEDFSSASGFVRFKFTGTGGPTAEQELLARSAAVRRSELLLVELRIVVETTDVPPTPSASALHSMAAPDDDGGPSSTTVVAIVIVIVIVCAGLATGGVIVARRHRAPKLGPVYRSCHRQHRVAFPELDRASYDDELLGPHEVPFSGEDDFQCSVENSGEPGHEVWAEPSPWAPSPAEPGSASTRLETPQPSPDVSARPSARRVQVQNAQRLRADPLLERDGFQPRVAPPTNSMDDL